MALDGPLPRPESSSGRRHPAGVGPAVRRSSPGSGVERLGRARASPAPLPVGGRGADDLGALRRGGGDPRRHRAPRVSARRRGRLHILTAHVATRPARSARRGSTSRGSRARLTPGTRLRLRGKQTASASRSRRTTSATGVETADFAPSIRRPWTSRRRALRSVTEERAPVRARRRRAAPAPSRRGAAPLRADALVGIHRPRGEDDAERARRRLALDELSTLEPRSAGGRSSARRSWRRRCRLRGELAARYREALRSRSPRRRSTRSPRSTPTSAARPPCSGSSRATSARARRRSRCTRCSGPWRRAGRAR